MHKNRIELSQADPEIKNESGVLRNRSLSLSVKCQSKNPDSTDKSALKNFVGNPAGNWFKKKEKLTFQTGEIREPHK